MTELESLLLRQLDTLSTVCEQQLTQQARRLTECSQLLSTQSRQGEELSLQVCELAQRVQNLSTLLESER